MTDAAENVSGADRLLVQQWDAGDGGTATEREATVDQVAGAVLRNIEFNSSIFKLALEGEAEPDAITDTAETIVTDDSGITFKPFSIRRMRGTGRVSFLDYKPPDDGVTSITTLWNDACAETAEDGRILETPNLGPPWVIGGSGLVVPQGARLDLSGAPEFETSLAKCISVTGAGVQIKGELHIVAAHSTSSYLVDIQSGATRFRIDDVVIENANSGVFVQAGYGLIKSLTVEEARGTGIRFDGAGACFNRLFWSEFRNVAGFGIYESGGAGKNMYGPTQKFVIPELITTWQRTNRVETGGFQWTSGGTPPAAAKYCWYGANTYTVSGSNAAVFGTIPPTHTSGSASDGVNTWVWTSTVRDRCGIEGFGATQDCSRSSLMMIHAFGTIDGGLTFSGDYYRVLGGLMEGNRGGWAANGRANTVMAVTSINNDTNGGTFSPAAGGEATWNRAVACFAEDNGRYGFRNDNIASRLWVSGATYQSATAYCYYGANIYQKAGTPSRTDTFGTIPPTHTVDESGNPITASDGLNDWLYIRSGDGTLDATKNQFIACDATGNGSSDWQLEGNGQVSRGPYFAADADGVVRGKMGLRGALTASAFGSEQWISFRDADLVDGAINVTNRRLISLDFTSAKTITDLVTSSTDLMQELIIYNHTSNLITIAHDGNKIRLLANKDRILSAYQGLRLNRLSGNIFGETASIPVDTTRQKTITAVSNNTFDATDIDVVNLNISGGAVINEITAATGPAVIYLRNYSSASVTLTNSVKIRTNTGADLVLGTSRGCTLLRIQNTTNNWQQV